MHKVLASRASMASIAESAGSAGLQDEILDADFSPRAVECFITPETTPTELTAGVKGAPPQVAKV
jgi:hypothetical protein